MVDLGNREIYSAIQEEAEDVLQSDDGQRAFIFIRNLPATLAEEENRNLAATNPELAAQYQALADQLSFVALPALPQEEIIGLFRDSILLGLRQERIDLAGKLKAALLAISAFENRDEFREKLRQALKENEQRIGSLSIGRWIETHERTFGARPVDDLRLNQFLANDASVRGLSDADQLALRRLFSLYEYVKLSSQTPEGLEDPVIFNIDGQLKKLNAGEWEEVKIGKKIDDILSKVFAFFGQEPGGGASIFDFGLVSSRTRELLAQTRGDAASLRSQLLAALGAAGRSQGLALLLLLAQLRQLDNLLEDPRFAKLVVDDLKKAGRDDNISGIRANPTAPLYLARLLKVILEDRLGLSREDAISFGARLSKILVMEGEKYQSIIKDNKWNL